MGAFRGEAQTLAFVAAQGCGVVADEQFLTVNAAEHPERAPEASTVPLTVGVIAESIGGAVGDARLAAVVCSVALDQDVADKQHSVVTLHAFPAPSICHGIGTFRQLAEYRFEPLS